jgi:hypothetical protein
MEAASPPKSGRGAGMAKRPRAGLLSFPARGERSSSACVRVSRGASSYLVKRGFARLAQPEMPGFIFSGGKI